MNLQKYRTHHGWRQPNGFPWGAEGAKGWRVMSRHHALQLWLAGIVLGSAITLTLWDLTETGGSRLSGNIVPPFLVLVSLLLAFNAVYWAPRPGDKPDGEKDDNDSLSFR